MSRCQWLPRGTCGQTQYEEQELHDLAEACGVSWVDRNYDEVCGDVAGVLQRLDAWKLQSERKHDDLDSITSEIKTLRALLAQFSDDHADSEVASLLRRRMRTLMDEQVELGRTRARELATLETTRQQQRTEDVQCEGMDLVTLDELNYSDPDVISIVVQADRPNRPQCYRRPQLLKAMLSATPLFEWSRRVPPDTWEPGNPLLQSIFLLPLGNLALTAQGYQNLADPHFRQFRLVDVGERTVGALHHTASAIWNATLRVYHAEPLDAPDFAHYLDGWNLFYVNLVNLKTMWHQYFPLKRYVLMSSAFAVPDESEYLGGLDDWQLEAFQRGNQKMAAYVYRRTFPLAGQDVVPSSFVSWDAIHTAPTFQPLLYLTDLANRLYIYGLTVRMVNPWAFAATQIELQQIDEHVFGLQLVEGRQPTLQQLRAAYDWEVAYVTRHFGNRNYLLGMVHQLLLAMPRDLDEMYRQRLLSTLSGPVMAPLINLDGLFYAFAGDTPISLVAPREPLIPALPDRSEPLDADESFVPLRDITERNGYDALDYSEALGNRLRLYDEYARAEVADNERRDAMGRVMRNLEHELKHANPDYPETVTPVQIGSMFEWEVNFLLTFFPLWNDVYALARFIGTQFLPPDEAVIHSRSTQYRKRLLAHLFQSISGDRLDFQELFIQVGPHVPEE